MQEGDLHIENNMASTQNVQPYSSERATMASVEKSERTSSPVPATEIAPTASYPTGSLDFLTKLQEQDKEGNSSLRYEARSRVQLRVTVVGAGLGGLSAAISLARKGHKVTVYEQAPALGEVCCNSPEMAGY
jgi:alkyl hydroperoxide reductase subunit AhpF